MKLDEGHVYILNEEDDRTGASDYYKIGMVSKDRSVKDRIEKDHQTGNPRRIVDVHSFHSDAPFLVERYLHKKFAKSRVRREWFRLTKDELEQVKQEAKLYDDVIGPKVAAVRGFSANQSNGSMISLSGDEEKEISKIHKELVDLNIKKQEIDYQLSIITEFLKLSTDKNRGGIDGITTVNVRGEGDPKFKYQLFRDSSPENKLIYEKFLTKRKISGPFKCSGVETKSKNHPALHKSEKAAKDKYSAEKATIDNVVDGTVSRTTTLENKHEEYINLIVEKEEITAEIFTRELEIMKACGDNEGIEGICVWKRQEKFDFDETSFKRAHPELFNDIAYHGATKASVSISVTKSRNYV